MLFSPSGTMLLGFRRRESVTYCIHSGRARIASPRSPRSRTFRGRAVAQASKTRLHFPLPGVTRTRGKSLREGEDDNGNTTATAAGSRRCGGGDRRRFPRSRRIRSPFRSLASRLSPAHPLLASSPRHRRAGVSLSTLDRATTCD